jgi:hypothetical protein
VREDEPRRAGARGVRRRQRASGCDGDCVSCVREAAAGGKRRAVLTVSDEDKHGREARRLWLARGHRRLVAPPESAADPVEDEDRQADPVRQSVLQERRGAGAQIRSSRTNVRNRRPH